ncbi:RNA polymerase sigma factor CnrH [Stieleria maiorica]|uniref:RNA polymerase sigma factor CnrH n=1 Tax=Stieleria maiorica TaxID=2795974 RepID=A0A5B9MMK4_9BACT|nr:sigma-70 family RNA polymerase sigma factor [Stieleria maiorica]QEG02632.1 RNA polymerase sigma factor CnrH [Stieleria maiorica]
MTEKDSAGETLTERQFMQLFVQHEPVLRVVARSMLTDWMAVDDVLQEAGVTMWEKIDQLENVDGFLPWARVIVRLKCHSAINSARRRRLVLSEEAIKLLAVEIDSIDRERYETNLTALQGCLQKLSPQQRELVLAAYRDGVEVQDIAARIGKSANALYKQLGRLRGKLSDCVELTVKTGAPGGGLAR